MLSEAVKLLKGEYCVRAIAEHKMDQAIIFCRTKVDCDNLETYFNSIGIIDNFYDLTEWSFNQLSLIL